MARRFGFRGSGRGGRKKKKKKIKNWISPVKKSVVMQGEEGGFHTK